MRNILWRVSAIALAGALSWLMWHWPEEQQPVEFMLEPSCDKVYVPAIDKPNVLSCWKDGVRIDIPREQVSK